MNYYNDNDKYCVKWIKSLIKNELIPYGDVDDRPIQEIQRKDLEGYTQHHFFCGIAGWSKALEIAGWPADVPVWSASCPCQSVSGAGKRKGEKDERHLWPELYRLISECKPVIIFGEQVESGDGPEWIDGISLDLEELGYAVGTACLPAACVGAPNRRQRLWWVAHSGSEGGCWRKEIQTWKNKKFRGSSENYSWVGEPDSPRRQQGVETTKESRQGGAIITTSFSNNRLGDTSSEGLQERISNKEIQREQAESIPWETFKLAMCTDKNSQWKLRRIPVESDIFPLSPNVPSRMGLLRGAGNSINPYVGAKFIRAFMDIVEEK